MCQSGWNTTSFEYAEHLARMERMPSVIADVPYFPNVQLASQDKVIFEEEWEEKHQQANRHKHQVPKAQKKVQFTEHEKITEVVKDGKGHEALVEKNINMEADGFIKHKHKDFELYKWPTFKVH